MAKSLRSKNVLRAKSIKREKVFQVMEDKRKQRLAEKMAEELENQPKAEVPEIKKVSTSGWRDSRSQKYKQKKASKKKKTMKF